jgi:hypothetical protein
MSFGFLKKYRAVDQTIPFTFDTLPAVNGKHPTLQCRYAGPGNDAFENARAKASWLSGGVSPKTTRKVNHEIMARILAETVVAGWEHVYEDDGPEYVKPVAFSVEKAVEFLVAIAEDKTESFEWFLSYVTRESPFVASIESPKVRAEDLGKE